VSDVHKDCSAASPDFEQRDVEVLKLCDELEAAWLAGNAPNLALILAKAPIDKRDSVLPELLRLDVTYRGRLKLPMSRDDYVAQLPDFAESVRAILDAPQAASIDTENRGLLATSDWKADSAENEPLLRVGDRLGHFHILELLGAGGMGAVYLAEDEALKKQVAIKVPHGRFFRSDAQFEGFLAEARAAAQLKHPGIVPVLHFGRDGGLSYFVMEYVDGESLEEVVKHGPPSFHQAAKITCRVAEIVAAIHRKGFVHRDLKLSNILLDLDGEPHVADFGLVLHETVQADHEGDRSGTCYYMSPEQVEGQAHWLDGRADLWALGVILYELLTGRMPFQGATREAVFQEILYREPKPPRAILDDVPAELERICLKCLAKPVAERYATADDLAGDLRRWQQPRRTNRNLLVAAAILLAAIIGLSAHFWPRPVDSSSTTTALRALAGQLDLLVWNKTDPSRRGLSLSRPEVMPLRENDMLRVKVDLNRPAYLYLVWIDSKGVAAPIYPWEPGKWLALPAHQSAVQGVNLPSVADEGWPIRGPGGMETLLLLARTEPLPENFDLATQLAGLPSQPMVDEHSLVWFDNGKLVTKEQDQTRGLGLNEHGRIDDAVLKAHRQIQERLGTTFPLIRAVSVASRGG
jgi:serine/threonine protein kinase